MNRKQQELTCIGCPMGCTITVTTQDGRIEEITGYTCDRGRAYAEKEVTAPVRIVTTTVLVEHGSLPVVSVKTRTDIPKGKIFACMQAARAACVEAPVAIGDVILENVADTGVDLVATRNIARVDG